MKRMFAMFSLAVILATTTFAQASAIAKATSCQPCCAQDCGTNCCDDGCSNCCCSK
jgi:hypothetical protein